jgi:poly(3-hydroxybutyrate) depolymerase
LLRGTLATMLPDHDVHVTDWQNARDVPLSHGRFGFDDFVGQLMGVFDWLGPGTHVVAICQPTVATLAAVALTAEDGHPTQPPQHEPHGRPERYPYPIPPRSTNWR